MTGYFYEKKAILTLSKSKHYIFVKKKLGFVDPGFERSPFTMSNIETSIITSNVRQKIVDF